MSPEIINAAIAIALAPPQHRGKASKAYVPWQYIEALREALLEGRYLSPRLAAWLERGPDRLANGQRPEEFKP